MSLSLRSGIGDIALSSALILCSAPLLSGCSGQVPVAEVLFAQFVPFGQGGVSTDAVLPPMGGSDPLLGAGWAPWSEDAAANGLWIHRHAAEFRFFAALRGGLTLELQGRPFSPAGAPPQEMTVLLNDEELVTMPLAPGRETHEISLPGSIVQEGWNHVRMEFAEALRPSDFIEGSRDTRRRAARFSRILVHSPQNRPLWPDRPSKIGLSNAGGSLAAAVIDMPTDSFMDVIVRPRAGQRLVGSVGATPIDRGKPADIRASVELLDEAGTSREVFSTIMSGDLSTRTTLQADLSEWAGQLVQIRVRSWGDSNAIIHWHGLGLSAPASAEREADASGGTVVDESAERGRLLRPTGSGEVERPDIILIMLDAARSDAFLGEDFAPATPNIDALAQEGTHFTSAWAPSSWTGQSMPAVYTGVYPDAVGAEVWGSRLAEGIPTLAELLAAEGYFTALWSQHTIYRRNPNLRRGFEAFELVVGARAIEDRMRLPSSDFLFIEGRPTFAVIHLLPPHEPYQAPEPFRGRHSSWYRGNFEVTSENLNRLQHDLPADRAELDEIIRYARGQYLENVEFADHLVGRLLQMLRDAGRYENTLVVVTSDHGEAFFEHERFLHTVQLYEELLNVPLFVKWPAHMNGFARKVAQPVTLLDLAPTMIDGLRAGGEAAVDGDAAQFHGKSLIPVVFDEVAYERGLYAYTRGKRRAEEAADSVHAYRSGKHKMIYSSRQDLLQLFDLEQDPGEEHDLAVEDWLRAKYLLQQAMLQRSENLALLARSGPQQVETLDPETLRDLRALGYIQ